MLSLAERDSLLEPGDRIEGDRSAGVSLDEGPRHHRPCFGLIRVGEMKVRRQNSGDDETSWGPILRTDCKRYRSSNDGGICTERPLPKRVAQDDDAGPARVVGRAEQPAP